MTYGEKISNEKEFLKNLKLLEISANIALIHQMLEEGTLIVSEPDSKNQTTYIYYHKIRFPLADGSSIKLTIKESPLGKLLYNIMILEE